MKIKIMRVFILFIILSVFLSSCSTKNDNIGEKVKVNEVTRSIFYAPQYVAMALGYFKDENIDIELITGEGSDKTMTAILASQSDIGLLGSSSVISVCVQGKENYPIIFSQLTKRDGSFLIGRTPEFNWEQLCGHSIIAGRRGSVPEMVLEYILKKRGIYENVNLITNIQFNLMGMAFSRGIGDYVSLFEPTASTLIKEKSFYNVSSLGTECDEIVYTCYCASPEYINNKKHIIKKFIKCIYKAQIWVKNHSASEISKLISPYFLDSSINMNEKCIEMYKNANVWNSTPEVDEKGLDFMQEIMIYAGELSNKIDSKKIINNEYSKSVIEDYKST